jgi:hypothetical protein
MESLAWDCLEQRAVVMAAMASGPNSAGYINIPVPPYYIIVSVCINRDIDWPTQLNLNADKNH